jgi:hypothetical protein
LDCSYYDEARHTASRGQMSTKLYTSRISCDFYYKGYTRKSQAPNVNKREHLTVAEFCAPFPLGKGGGLGEKENKER